MGIRIIRKGKSYRRWWYGEYRESGKLFRIKLDVKVSGKPPESFSSKDEGDKAFEINKAKAQSAFDVSWNLANRRETLKDSWKILSNQKLVKRFLI